MPIICRACQGLVADDAAFCGYCGFKLAPLQAREAPILLTKVKRKSEEVRAEAAARRASGSGPTPHGEPPARRTPETGPSPAEPAARSIPEITPTPHTEPPVRRVPPTGADSFPPRAPRFPLKVEVSYNSEHNFFTGFMENICEGGLFIATHTPGKLGDFLEVSFTVPGLERSCTVICRVRWIRDYDPDNPDTIPGMGCQFGALETHVAAAIQAFLEHRDPIFFD